MATCSPQTLMDSAACFACLPPNTLAILELQLLCEISAALSGGSTGVLQTGHGQPTGATSVTPVFYLDLDSGTLYTYDGSSWR